MCQEFCSRGGDTWAGTPGTRYTPQDHVHPLRPGTPPRTRYTHQDQVSPRTRYTPLGPGTPPGPGTPLGTRYTPWDQVPPTPTDLEHHPRPGTPYPQEPGTPPRDQVHPLGPGTPPRTRYTPWDQVHNPPPGTRYTSPLGPGTPSEQCMLGDMGNKRALRILLECILVCNLYVAFRENWQNNMLTPPHPLSNLESAIPITIANVLKKKLSLSPEFMIWCEI